MKHFCCRNVTKRYHYDKRDTLHNFCAEVERGEQVTFLMDMQSGKSTLCKILCGLESFSGEIDFLEKPLKETLPKDRNILYLPKEPLMLPLATVKGNLNYVLKIRKTDKVERERIVKGYIKTFNLDDCADKRAKTLTAEQAKNLVLARGFCRKPQLVLCDGFCDDDDETAKRLMSLCRANNVTLVFLTADVESASTQRIVTFFDNKVVCDGDKQNTAEAVKDLLWLNTLR